MDGIRFNVAKGTTMAYTDRALVRPGEALEDALRDAVIDNLSTDLWVKVSGVENHLAAWLDPAHWSEEWKEHAGEEDPVEYVYGLLLAAKEEV
jgi:hypothetical protein